MIAPVVGAGASLDLRQMETPTQFLGEVWVNERG